MVSVSGIDVKFGRIALILIVMGGFTYLYVHYGSGNSSTTVQQQQQQPVLNKAELESPPKAKQDTPNDGDVTTFKTLQMELELSENKKCDLKYITNDVAPDTSMLNMLLLNGDDLDETTWETIGTMKYLKDNSYAAAAVNVTATANCTGGDKTMNALVIPKVISKLQFNESKLVIVSPTSSALLSLPYILSGAKKARALLAIMPNIPEDLNVDEKFSGQKDIVIKLVYDKEKYSDKNLEKLIPISIQEDIKGMSPQYLRDNSKDWNELLKKFLASLIKSP